MFFWSDNDAANDIAETEASLEYDFSWFIHDLRQHGDRIVVCHQKRCEEKLTTSVGDQAMQEITNYCNTEFCSASTYCSLFAVIVTLNYNNVATWAVIVAVAGSEETRLFVKECIVWKKYNL